MSGTQDRIVVGVDGSESSVAALRHAVRLSEALGVPLEVVTCWEDTLLYDSYRVVEPEEFRRGGEERLERTLADVFGDRRPENLTARTVRGQAASRLVEESEHALLLVVGRRGGGGLLLGGVLGSVSSALVTHAKCPVLVVRH